jgi:protein-tyrosine-phosphatase
MSLTLNIEDKLSFIPNKYTMSEIENLEKIRKDISKLCNKKVEKELLEYFETILNMCDHLYENVNNDEELQQKILLCLDYINSDAYPKSERIKEKLYLTLAIGIVLGTFGLLYYFIKN